MRERSTPETDTETMRDEYDHVDTDFGPFAPSDTVPADFARCLERERDEAREAAEKWRKLHDDKDDLFKKGITEVERERDEAREALSEIALYLSVGMGDETTTAQQYKQRILEGIKMLSEPIVNLWKQAEKERDEARKELEEYRSIAEKIGAKKAVSEKEKAIRERDEAREKLEEEKMFHHRTHSELIQTQCRLMDVTQAIIDTLEENRHLADGDDCTLAKLKSVVPEWK